MEKVEYKEIKSEDSQTPVPPVSFRVYINKDQYFEGVIPEVWNFHIGGYQVCEKWLKDRKGLGLCLMMISPIIRKSSQLLKRAFALWPR